MWEHLSLAWRDGWWHSNRIKQQSCPLLKALISEQAEAAALWAVFILITLYFLSPARPITQCILILYPLSSGPRASFAFIPYLHHCAAHHPLQEFWYTKIIFFSWRLFLISLSYLFCSLYLLQSGFRSKVVSITLQRFYKTGSADSDLSHPIY